MPRLPLLAAAVVLAAALLTLPVAPASAQTKKMVLSVDVTGIHVVDWTHRSDGYPEACRNWTTGSGTQTVGFSTPRPMRVTALLATGRKPAGLPKVQLLATGQGRWRATVERRGEWEDHVPNAQCTPCGPNSEYGECAPPGDGPITPTKGCGRKTLPKPVAALTYVGAGEHGPDELAPVADALQVDVATAVGDRFAGCPPEVPTSNGLQLRTPDPLSVRIVHGLGKLRRLAVGRTITLKGDAEHSVVDKLSPQTDDRCPKEPEPGPGYRECAVTDVTLKIRRLR